MAKKKAEKEEIKKLFNKIYNNLGLNLNCCIFKKISLKNLQQLIDYFDDKGFKLYTLRSVYKNFSEAKEKSFNLLTEKYKNYKYFISSVSKRQYSLTIFLNKYMLIKETAVNTYIYYVSDFTKDELKRKIKAKENI